MAEQSEEDRAAVEAYGEVFAGSDRRIVVTGGPRPRRRGRAADGDRNGLPMLDILIVASWQTVIGFAAGQIVLMRGTLATAAAGDTFAGRPRTLDAAVTPNGDGMPERVRDIATGMPDLICDAGPISRVATAHQRPASA